MTAPWPLLAALVLVVAPPAGAAAETAEPAVPEATIAELPAVAEAVAVAGPAVADGAPDDETALPALPVEAEKPEDPARLFVLANDAYQAGEYDRAAELYRRILERGIDTGHLHYNLGNAYLRGGELGRAIAAYRRSQLRLPRDEDVRANLEFARRTTRDALEPPSPSPVVSTLFFWHYGLSLGELATATVVGNLLLWGLLAARLLGRGREALRWLTIAVLVPLLAVGGSLALRLAQPRRVAVVLPQEVAAQSGPGADAVVRFKLHAGTEVRVRDQRDGWLRISLPDGQQGWIEARWAEVVEG